MTRGSGTETPAGGERFGLVLTGGTIGSRINADMVRLSEDPSVLPEAQLLNSAWNGDDPFNEDNLHVMRPLRRLSEDMVPADWVRIAKEIRRVVDSDKQVSRILVLHGTDTATYTAAALSFLLSDLALPIVLTGANHPVNHPHSDAPTNLRGAVAALRGLERGTYLSFAGSPGKPSLVHLGTRVRKLKASGQAFCSVNRDVVAEVKDQEFIPRSMPSAAEMPRRLSAQRLAVDPNVGYVRLFPGCDLAALADMIVSTKKRGVVVELYPSATGPTVGRRESLPLFTQRCVEAGVVVVATIAMAPDPGEMTYVYESTQAIRNSGAQFFGDLMPETAIVKLMWALAQAPDPMTVVEIMARPLAGELSPTA